ncbi:glycoside hydrolase family 75 protein [Spirosoma fluviale]|uniref:Chitosanase of glycosyl hydrolase group 75 n=1 Tax=Spirosoma fluviale TaxID=1597977 RepID=A0A286F662_9BACT|nr:glycoside hydrolase family 75 protein [Spirosoma fluviale]SOD78690.1 chitosanase of glycosyl hydrolase group 75 [Spirosoma fluviale]
MKQLSLLIVLLSPVLVSHYKAPVSQGQFVPPAASAQLLKRVAWNTASAAGQKFRDRFRECDTKDFCDGVKLKFGCKSDQNRNTALLKFPNGVVFFDAKMGLDADGSPLSKKTPGLTDQPETSFRFNVSGHPSVDSDKVPFIVIPLGGFDTAFGVKTGDLAAVVFNDKLVFALIADKGPKCKLGEGSIELHEKIGHPVCLSRNAQGECTKLRNVGIGGNVLYFLFPGSAIPDLTPANANQKIAEKGKQLFDKFLATGNS